MRVSKPHRLVTILPSPTTSRYAPALVALTPRLRTSTLPDANSHHTHPTGPLHAASSVHSFQLPHLPAALSLGHKYRTWYLIFAQPHRTANSREITHLDAPSLAPRTPGPRHCWCLCTTHFSLSFNNVYNGLSLHPLTARQNRLHGISHSDSAVARATGIIVESGLLFLAVQFVFVVLFAIGHPAQAVLVPVATQVYGISPTLIIVRVRQGAAYEARTQTTSSTRLSGLRFAGFARGVAVRGVEVSGRGRGGGRRSSLQRHSERAAHDKDLAPDLEMSRTRKEDNASSGSLHLPTSRKSMDMDSNGSLHLPTPRKSVDMESNVGGDVEDGRGSL
ncbi:hypothetical protein B0H16DRAFT_1822817 [Mycena metata]|uniref:Uncharacterized protein n=1 Tax=Mycena metata TaxID=1033252 RepID=A0AAD7NFS6_9AGAR|nr:hypothetical protein B0H16DRAFT_1822817 [Mycena metata]